MIRRILLVAAAAAALAFVPSVAMAYNAPGYGSSVSDSTPAAGSSVTLTVHGQPNETLKVVVTSSAGVKTYSVTTNASGVGTLSIPAGAAGTTMSVQVFNAAGQLVSDQTLNVDAATTSGDSGFPTNTGATTPTSTNLAFTGFDGAGLAAGGAVLVLVGAGAVVVTKRRRSAKATA